MLLSTAERDAFWKERDDLLRETGALKAYKAEREEEDAEDRDRCES